jgi:hypothetical protein
MHGFGGQQDREFHDEVALASNSAQFELAAAGDHVIEHRIESELIFARPFRD